MNVVSRKTEIISALHINIVYEDQSVTDITVFKDDIVEIEYMQDGTNKRIQGRISDINVVGARSSITSNKLTTSLSSVEMLTIDASTTYKSEQILVNINNIITITKIIIEEPTA
jgi:hypothetical protein